MNCAAINRSLALYVVDGLNAREQREVEEHLATCQICRRECDALRQTAVLLQRLPAPAPPDDLWEKVAARTVARPRHPLFARWRVLAVGAAFAVLVFGVLLMLQTWHGSVYPAAPFNIVTAAYAAEYHQASQHSDARFMSRAQAEQRAGFPWVAPSWLPAGYREAGYLETPCVCGCGDQVIAGMYRHGDHTLVIYQDMMGQTGCAAGAACGAEQQGGCVQAQLSEARMVARTVGRRTLAVLGTESIATLAHVTEGIQP